jgi:hypothetical protein
VIHGNAGDGIYVDGENQEENTWLVCNNLITSNGGYGINAQTTWHEQGIFDYNAYYNNTSGLRNNLTAGPNDVTLTADPYTSESTDDYTLNATAGGGAACKDAGYGYNG